MTHHSPVTDASSGPTRGGRLLVGAAIVALALDLRVAVGSLGVLLDDVRASLGMSSTLSGVLTTLPVLCFAVVGLGSHVIVRRLGLHGSAVTLLLAITVGLGVRAVAHSSVLFMMATAVALAGAAIGNVILPPLVKLHFPDRVAFVSSLYGAAIMGGAAISSLVSVPLADGLGGWRPSLGSWGLLAALTVLPWLVFLRRPARVAPEAQARLSLGRVARSPLAWAMVVLFMAQSAGAYAQFGWLAQRLTDAGVSDGEAGVMLGVISVIGFPLTLSLPRMIRAVGDRAWLPWAFSGLTMLGWLGVWLAPTHGTLVWSVLLGLGGGSFTWTLTMIGHRARTPSGTAALSVFTQGLGYLLAGIGPFGVGLLHQATGGWAAPMVLLIVLAALIGVSGTIVARPAALEDSLPV